MCSESWQRKIKCVRLEGASFLVEENNKAVYDLHLIVYWCQIHPHTIVYLPHQVDGETGQQNPAEFFIDGIMLQSAIQRNFSKGYLFRLAFDLGLYHSLFHARMDGRRYRKLWRPDELEKPHVRKIYLEAEIGADNFRVLPEDGPFDEHAFRRAIEGMDRLSSSDRNKPVGERAERWVELARGWYERGFVEVCCNSESELCCEPGRQMSRDFGY
jgi:hypothetical protein